MEGIGTKTGYYRVFEDFSNGEITMTVTDIRDSKVVTVVLDDLESHLEAWEFLTTNKAMGSLSTFSRKFA